MRKSLMLCLLAVAMAAPLRAATFVVPEDREMIERSHLIVVATAIDSFSRQSALGGIETVTPMAVEEVIKGEAPRNLDVVEPGGELKGVVQFIPGVPRFETGQRMLLFLRNTGPDRYAVTDLVLGKFKFAEDESGAHVLARDENEIIGWDPNLQPHKEHRRDAARFVQFVRDEAHGRRGNADYFVASRPLAVTASSTSPSATTTSTVASATGYSATSYTMAVSGSLGARWNVFPNAVTFYAGASGEPGAPGNGTTAVQTSINSWDNDCGSNVNYVYGGTDSTHTSGLHSPDGANTVLFERDLSSWGVTPFSCSSNSYGGTLGLGGVTSASGTHSFNGETFSTTIEGDVEMNKGIANCSLLFSNGDFNSAVAHELGHTLGFRHSDQDRNSSGACTATAGLECSTTAIMKSFVSTGLNAALQTWDIHAVDTVYPGNVCAPNSTPTCTAPAITSGPTSQTINAGQSVTLSVAATGSTPLTYDWFIGNSGSTTNPAGSGQSITVTPSATTSFWVRVSNACGTANSGAATITVNTVRKRVHGDYDGDGKTDPAVYRPSNGTWYFASGRTVVWGGGADIPAPADYDGDGKTDIAIYRPSTATFYIISSATGGTTIRQWGQSGDDPVSEDYDGDGKADIAVYRPSTGLWLILQSSNGATRQFTLGGTTGDQPCPADFDGDGRDDPAVENKNTGKWQILQSTTGTVRVVQWGGSGGDIAVPADFDGDGKADITMESQLDGKWYIILSANGATRVAQWGGSGGDQPQPGYYDGDQVADICVFNNGNQKFYIWLATGATQIVTLGQSGDIGVSYY